MFIGILVVFGYAWLSVMKFHECCEILCVQVLCRECLVGV